MDDVTNAVYRQHTYEYVEMQDAESYREDYDETPVAVKVFSALIVPALLLAFLVWLMKRATKQTRLAVDAAAENTKVIVENNELLRENIALQREILKAMQKSNGERG